ncbi:unnamed protein product [Rhodiola kirilowii]
MLSLSGCSPTNFQPNFFFCNPNVIARRWTCWRDLILKKESSAAGHQGHDGFLAASAMGFLCLQTLVLSSSPGCELVLLRGSKNSREAVKQYGYLCIEFCCIRVPHLI